MKRMLFCINPVTAKAILTPNLIDIIDIFNKAGYNVETYISQAKRDIEKHVFENGSKFDTIVVAGGDGTLNELASGILPLHHKPIMGYIPSGTTNDFANSWGISRSPVTAAKKIAEGIAHVMDVNIFNGRPYIYVAAFGFLTEASYNTSQQLKQAFGYAAYLVEGIKSLGNIRPISMTCNIDGATISGDFLYGMIANTRRVGGIQLKVKDSISISDGLMEIFLVRNPDNPADNPKVIGALLTQDTNSDYIIYRQAKNIHFDFKNETTWTLDGENGGTYRSVDINVSPASLKLFM